MPKLDIDHIDGNKDNNAILNLRLVTHSENMQNRICASINNKTGHLGVSEAKEKRKKSYRATIGLNNKKIHIGYYANAELAYKAYIEKKREIHKFSTI